MNGIAHRLRHCVVDYVMARRCRGGGFCFYRLEEPNGADTYHALTILSLLGVPFRDRKTESWLRRMQSADGSYDGIYAAFFSIYGLRLLKQKPDCDPGPYIARCVSNYRLDAGRLPAEVTSLFQRTACLIRLFLLLGSGAKRRQRGRLIRLVLAFRNGDGGFGNRRSTLTDTAYALRMLHELSYSVVFLGAETFIGRCEVAPFGFTDIPDSSLSYLECLDAGATASYILNYRPRYLEACIDFIVNCQNRNGGFARAMHGGIATLENTSFAVHALKMLEAIGENNPG